MRRLAVVFALLLALFAAASASAAKPPADLVVTKGSAHVDGANLSGWLVVANHGGSRSVPSKVTIRVVDSGAPDAARRTITQRAAVPPLDPGAKERVRIAAAIPSGLGAGSWQILGCARGCRAVGSFTMPAAASGGGSTHGQSGTGPETGGSDSAGGSPGGGTPPGGDTPGAPAAPPSEPISTVPTDPIAHPVGEPFEVSGGGVRYWAFVPETYDPSNQMPTPLLVWLHGCYGEAEGEAWVVDPGEEAQPPQDWLTLALAGREGGVEGVCWVPSVDEAKVMAALADFETHFDVDPRRVVLGGYSSGGDLAYRTGFRHSATFAGLLIENSSPFRDTESTEAESLAAATTKLHIVHLAHLQDATYPIAGVRAETEAVKAAGFPLERIEVDGGHFDEPGAFENGHAVPGTDADLRTYLLPHIDDGWLAPAP